MTTERERLRGLIARFQDKANSAKHTQAKEWRHGYGGHTPLVDQLGARYVAFQEAADILRAELDKLAPEGEQPYRPIPEHGVELIRALTEWKDSGTHPHEVMVAIDYYLQERVPEIVAFTLRRKI